MVETVLQSGGAVTGVAGTVRIDGSTHRLEVRARQVVIAAGALRTPLILQRSGLGHPVIGRHLRLHPVATIGARLPGDVTMWRGTSQATRSLAFLGGEVAGGQAPHGFVIESAPGTPGLIALAFPWEGTQEFATLMEGIRQFAPLIGIVQDRGGGTVRWSRAGTARIDYGVATEDAAMLRRALIEMGRIARAAGARELVALGTPPVWYRSGATRGPMVARSGCSNHASPSSRSRRTGGRSSRRTRWAAVGPERMRAGIRRSTGPRARGIRARPGGAGPLRRRCVALPDGVRDEPDADHDDPRPQGGTSRPGRG